MAYDATAAAAARREHLGDLFSFLWDGVEFVMDKPDEWPAGGLDDMSSAKPLRGFLRVLEASKPGQREKIERLTVLRQADVEGILDAAAKHYGVGDDSGE